MEADGRLLTGSVRTLGAFARRYLAPYVPWYVGGTVALAATNLLSVTMPLYLAAGIDALAAPTPDRATAARMAAWVAVMGLTVIGVRTLSRVLFFTPGRLVEQALKRDLFAALLAHQPSFHRRSTTGDLFSRVANDVNHLRLLAGFGLLQVANTVLALGLAGGQMVRVSGDLALVVLVPIGIGLVVVQTSIRRLYVLMRRLQEQVAVLSNEVLATLRGLPTVQAFGAEAAFEARLEAHNQAILGTTLEQARVRAALGPVLTFAADVNLFLLLAVGGPRVIRGELTVGELVALTTLVGFVTGPLRASSFLWQVVRQGQAALERVDGVLGTPADRPDLPHAQPAPARPPALSIRHLSIRHPGADADALHDVSIEVPAGTTLGVLGATGAGKTTLLRALARLVDPPAGTILVDGTDLRAVDLDGWRAAATLVPQRAFLFSGTLADNVLLDQHGRERLAAALHDADLARDVAQLPEGVDTVVGEAGIRLSGGQRQRTALARALVRPHVVLLLDDVLSAVDHGTEKRLLATLRAASGARVTTVLVAHRVSALLHADRVVVLDGGRKVDEGTPAELLSRPGPFRDTWEAQQRAGEAA